MEDEKVLFIVGFLLGLIISGVVCVSISQREWQRDMIERGYAHHCPIDGKFAFNDECKK
jgi:hypothetical protein